MTVSSNISKSGPYAGNGVTTVFPITFRFLDNTHLQVIHTSTTGVETTWVESTHYTVVGAGLPGGGTLTVITAPTDYTPQVNEKLTIVRNMPFTQEVDYVSNDPFPAETHEEALDEREMEIQQIKEQVSRAVVFPVSGSLSSLEFPTPTAGLALGWNATEDGLTNLTIASIPNEVLPATANTYLRRNAANTMFDDKTPTEVFDDVKIQATETYLGCAEIATQVQTDTGTDDTTIITPLKLRTSASSETMPGVIQIATQVETDAGTDDTKAITPLKLETRLATSSILVPEVFTSNGTWNLPAGYTGAIKVTVVGGGGGGGEGTASVFPGPGTGGSGGGTSSFGAVVSATGGGGGGGSNVPNNGGGGGGGGSAGADIGIGGTSGTTGSGLAAPGNGGVAGNSIMAGYGVGGVGGVDNYSGGGGGGGGSAIKYILTPSATEAVTIGGAGGGGSGGTGADGAGGSSGIVIVEYIG